MKPAEDTLPVSTKFWLRREDEDKLEELKNIAEESCKMKVCLDIVKHSFEANEKVLVLIELFE